MRESPSPPPAPGAAPSGEEGFNDAWLQSEMHDLFLSRETGTSLSSAALDEAIKILKKGDPLSLPQAFDLLHQAQLGDMRIFGQMPVRATASPFIPSLGSAYIVSRRLCRDDQSSSGVDAQHQAEAISVTFQSILNSEVWWSRDVLGFGVAARPMGRNIRTWKKSRERHPEGGAASPTELQRSEAHGYRGRLYTLVARKTELPNAVRARAEAASGAPSSATSPQSVDQQQLLAAAAQQAAQQQQQASAGGFVPVAQPQQPTSGPPSPTRSTSPTRASKRPRGGSGSGAPGGSGQSERYIAVGDIGIVQVWRPRAPFEPPRTPAAGPPYRVDPTAQQAVPLGGPQMLAAGGPLVVPPNYLPPDPNFPGAPQSVRRPIAQPMPRGESPLDEKPRFGVEPGLPTGFFQPQSHFESSDIVLNGNLRVRGDIICEGRVFGQFITGPRQADYSEWFKWHDDHLPAPQATVAAVHDEPATAQAEATMPSLAAASRNKPPPPGSVVRLRPPEQVLTLDTNGPGPCMIVSTSPSLAAGVPVEPTEAETGALVAFMGQVPVRCRGAVKVGDQLVPSGLGDGTAIARLSDDDDVAEDRAVGVAMEAIDDDGDVHVVNAFIRWDNAMSRKLGQVVGEAVDELGRRVVNVGRGVVALWLIGTVLSLALVGGCTFFDAPPKLHAALDQPLRVVLKFLALMAFGTTILLVLLLRTAFLDLHVLLAFWGLFLFHYFVGAVVDAIDYQNHTATLTLDASFTVLALVYHWILLRALSSILHPKGPTQLTARQQRPSRATRLAALLGRVARGTVHSSKAHKVSDHDGASNDS